MANRYWVGGAGTWNTSSTTNWSASSGGVSGASAPTAADSVFFDQTGTYTVTVSSALCLDINVSAGTVTFSGAATISGSMTLLAGTVWSSGNITFNSTSTGRTVTTNGVEFVGAVTFNGVGGGWTLGSALSARNNIAVFAGTLDTSVSNYSITVSAIGVPGAFVNVNGGALILNNSVVSSAGTGGFTYISGTLNTGTSTINLSNATTQLLGGGRTYYNVSFTSTALTTASITGANTFNNLTIAARAASGIGAVSFAANQTISGTFTVSAGTNASFRTFLLSNTIGTARTLTCAAISTLSDVDFRDITVAGAAAPVSGTNLGDCKGNSGITGFPAAKTVYWNLAGNNNWSATAWATSAGGSVAANNFPLAQDTAIFTSTSPATGATTTVNGNWNIGTIDMSARTSNTMTLATGTTTPAIYGNWINGTGTTLSGTGQITFGGRTTQTITAAGITFTQGFTIDSPAGTVTLQDALTTSRAAAGAVTLTNGTLDLNGQTLTLSATATATFLTATGTKNLTFNGGSLVLAASGTTAFNNAVPTGFTTTAGTGTGTISLTNASAKTFVGGGSTYNCTLNQGGAGALTITGSNTFSDITNTYSATGATSILFTAGTTSTFTNWNASGASGNLLTIGSVTAASHTLSKASGTVNADFLSISRSTATGGAAWYAGANSTDGGNNTGWIFTAAPSGGNSNFFALF